MIHYHIATELPLPPVQPGIEYWVARNGVFARASRPGLYVLIPVSRMEQPLKGLIDLYPIVEVTPLVPIALFEQMCTIAHHNLPNEVLFHLVLENGAWELLVPEQTQSRSHCQPLDTSADSSSHQALIEFHSHGTMPAYFSATDDTDECDGFRVYGVIGKLDQRLAELLVRVGLFGHAYTVPEGYIFDRSTSAFVIQKTGGTTYYAMRGADHA